MAEICFRFSTCMVASGCLFSLLLFRNNCFQHALRGGKGREYGPCNLAHFRMLRRFFSNFWGSMLSNLPSPSMNDVFTRHSHVIFHQALRIWAMSVFHVTNLYIQAGFRSRYLANNISRGIGANKRYGLNPGSFSEKFTIKHLHARMQHPL